MVVEASLPTIATVLFTAAIDSINPCAIGVMILLVSTVISNTEKRSKMVVLASAYIFAVFITYLIAGLGLIAFLQYIPLWITEYIAIIVAITVIGAGLVELKDYYWYGEGFSLAIGEDSAKKIHTYAKDLTVPGVMVLGAFVAGVELPCTGGPYLAITLLLAQNFNLTAFLLLVLYNIIFVMPLILILVFVLLGMKIQDVKEWKQSNRNYMRLAMGLLMVILGWLLILIANGTINFG